MMGRWRECSVGLIADGNYHHLLNGPKVEVMDFVVAILAISN